jgi:pyrroline-5-carboxylate reductase
MRVGFIGAGHIARALGQGWRRPGLANPPALLYHDVAPDAAARVAAETGATVAATLAELIDRADVVIVAVRPQDVAGVLAAAAAALGARLLVSVAAGVSLQDIRTALPDGARAARVMPNVAAALGLGVFLFVPGTLGEARRDVEALFALSGEVVPVAEAEFDSATAVAGCMPGMLAVLVRDFARAGVERGLDEATARRLAIAGVHGAAAVIDREGDPDAVIASAATPGGMTAAAIAALEERDVAAAVALAVHAAAERAKELK